MWDVLAGGVLVLIGVATGASIKKPQVTNVYNQLDPTKTGGGDTFYQAQPKINLPESSSQE